MSKENKRNSKFWLIGLLIVILALQGLMLTGTVFAEDDFIIHIVESGDYLYRLAREYNVTVEAIQEANDLGDSNVVKLGQELKIPTGGEVYALDAEEDIYTMDADEDWGKGGEPINPIPPGLDADKICIEVVNADIRDVLTALAIKMDVQILFIDEPVRVTFKICDVTPTQALELFVQSQSLSYIREGDLVVVGKLERLQTDFYKQMVVTRLDLDYISAETLAGILSTLSIPLQQVTMAANPQVMWVQGTPQAIYKVAKIIEEVDIPGQNATIVTHELKHVAAQYASERLSAFGFPGIQIINLGYPEFSRNLVVVVPAHLAGPVESALNSIDTTSTAVVKIRIPLAGGSIAYLEQLRDRLEYAFDDQFTFQIVDDLLWVEETPDNIQTIKEMVDLIALVDV